MGTDGSDTQGTKNPHETKDVERGNLCNLWIINDLEQSKSNDKLQSVAAELSEPCLALVDRLK